MTKFRIFSNKVKFQSLILKISSFIIYNIILNLKMKTNIKYTLALDFRPYYYTFSIEQLLR